MWQNNNVAALVVAAGYSSRMVRFKPLLPLGGATVIERVIDTFKQAGIVNITVVVGHRADELIPILDAHGVGHVFNEKYNEGMFSSIQKGVQALLPATKAFFLLPADMPLVKSHTVRLLTRAFRKQQADIVYPTFENLRGHPPLIASNCFAEILASSGEGGLRQILEEHKGMTYYVEVLDEGISLDLDTYEDYQKISIEYDWRHVPTAAECDAMLRQWKIAEPIVRHGRVVAEVAAKLARGLQQVGINIDIHAVSAAGKLHDIAKGKANHAGVGARIIKKYGYPKIAQIIAAHTDVAIDEEQLINEAIVVYLADKLVKGDGVVSLHERFSSALEKYADDAEAKAAIITRSIQAERIEKRIEQLLGVSLAQIITD